MNLITLYNNRYTYIGACRVNKDAIRPCGKTSCKLCEVGAVENYWPIMHTQNGKCVILPLTSTVKEMCKFECVACDKVLKGEKASNVFHHVETRLHYEVAS